MTPQSRYVLDASALLAYLRNEQGADEVRKGLRGGAVISAVNWAEVLTKLADLGEDPEIAARQIMAQGLAGAALRILPFDEDLARQTAMLKTKTRPHGLSLGDRACLALGRHLSLPVLTADHQWRSLHIGVDVRAVR